LYLWTTATADRIKFYGKDAIYPTGFPYWMGRYSASEIQRKVVQLTLKSLNGRTGQNHKASDPEGGRKEEENYAEKLH
jgi:hypothetical protein